MDFSVAWNKNYVFAAFKICINVCQHSQHGHSHSFPLVFPTKYIYIKSTTLYVPSLELGLSHPLARQRVCPSPPEPKVGGGAHSPAGEGLVGRVPIPTTGEKAQHSAYCVVFPLNARRIEYLVEICQREGGGGGVRVDLKETV